MNQTILGLHHITAIAGNAKLNHHFYSKILGQRLVKKTVNFDDPETYHLYYADETGTPGSVLTFFPWEKLPHGGKGTGISTEVAYSVPVGSLIFWKEHLRKNNIQITDEGVRFNENYLTLIDYDRLLISLIETEDTRKPWSTSDVSAAVATRGFHSTTLTLKNIARTVDLLTEVFGYVLERTEVNRHRYKIESISTANLIDLEEIPALSRPKHAGGTVHHVAFRVRNEDDLILSCAAL